MAVYFEDFESGADDVTVPLRTPFDTDAGSYLSGFKYDAGHAYEGDQSGRGGLAGGNMQLWFEEVPSYPELGDSPPKKLSAFHIALRIGSGYAPFDPGDTYGFDLHWKDYHDADFDTYTSFKAQPLKVAGDYTSINTYALDDTHTGLMDPLAPEELAGDYHNSEGWWYLGFTRLFGTMRFTAVRPDGTTHIRNFDYDKLAVSSSVTMALNGGAYWPDPTDQQMYIDSMRFDFNVIGEIEAGLSRARFARGRA